MTNSSVVREIETYGPSSSFKIGELPEGCARCISGEKIVLYTTGSCSVNCSYCPIPEDRTLRDDVFINERKLDELETLFDESEKCAASGMGITGGDPMEVPERTLSYIQKVREEYGEPYHLHLYTSGKFFMENETLIDRLFAAGLDELRMHPRELRSYEVWEIAKRAKERFPHKSIGFEVPVIPGKGKDLEKLILFADEAGLDFVNLNEFEFTESNFNKLSQRGFVSVLTNAAAVGSRDTALDVIAKVKDKTTITLHFCSSGSKDSIQLAQRFRRRASRVRQPYEEINEDGLLEHVKLTCKTPDEFNDLVVLLEDYFDLDERHMMVDSGRNAVKILPAIAYEIVEEIREGISVEARLISKFPIDDSPIVRVDPF